MTTKTFPSVTLTTAPAATPLTVAETRPILRIASSETGHDPEITRLLKASTLKVLNDTGIVLVNTTFTQKQESFNDEIELTRRPVSSVTSVKYYDSANALQTLATSVYVLDTERQTIRLKPSQTWPAVYSRWDAVEVVYVAGYGAAATAVPEDLRQLVALLCRYDFDGDEFHLRAYETMVTNQFRSSYP